MSATDFLDTNVLLYLTSSDAAKAQRAEDLLADRGVVSVQVLNEFASVALRKFKMRMDEVRDLLTGIRVVCTVVPLDVAMHERGFDIAERYRIELYDAMIVAAALQAGCNTLYTEDMHDGHRIDGLTIRNPFNP